MQIEVVSTESELDRLSAEWNELLADSDTDNPFLQWEWCSTWWRHYGEGHELVVVLVRDGDQLVGLAPLYVERAGDGPQRGVMKFLGTGEVCSEYLSFVLRHGREPEGMQSILEFLLASSGIGWRQLRLNHLLADGPAAPLIESYLRTTGRPFRVKHGHKSWLIELAGSWDEFLQQVSRSRRERLRRMRRDIERSGLQFGEVSREEEIGSAWAELKRLHQARWVQVGKQGCFASPRFAAFHEELLRPLWQRGMLSLNLLRHDGRAVAASYSLRHRGRVYFYQAGVDPEQMRFRPGHALRLCELIRAMERGDRVFDFLSGDEEYKAHWATNETAMLNFTVAGRGLLPSLRFRLQSATQWAMESAQSHMPADTWATLRRLKKRLTEKNLPAPPQS